MWLPCFKIIIIGNIISNNTSDKMQGEINKLVSWLQTSEFSQDVPVNNYEGCCRIVALMTRGSENARIDLFDVRNVARSSVNAEKIRYKIDESESAGYICKMIFNNEVVTLARSALILAAIQVADVFTNSNLSPKMKDKISVAAGNKHKTALFCQPEVDSCDICCLQFCVNTDSSVVKVYCSKTICCGCMWSIIRSADKEKEMQCLYCRTTFNSKQEYLDMLIHKADFNEASAGAMCELGSRYYYGKQGLQKYVAKSIKIWTDLARTFTHQEVCYYLGFLFRKVAPNMNRARYYFEKAAILGNAKARFIVGQATPDRKDALKHFEIAARQGHKKSMTYLLKACAEGEIEKGLHESILRAHHDIVKSTESDSRTWGNAMQDKTVAFAKSVSEKH